MSCGAANPRKNISPPWGGVGVGQRMAQTKILVLGRVKAFWD